VDALWWSDTLHTAPEPSPLWEVLSADGWQTVAANAKRRLLVQEFENDAEYRSALARARFSIPEHLLGQSRDAPLT
jgi:hypothetical protein